MRLWISGPSIGPLHTVLWRSRDHRLTASGHGSAAAVLAAPAILVVTWLALVSPGAAITLGALLTAGLGLSLVKPPARDDQGTGDPQAWYSDRR
jgi:hypothetical protein